MSKEEKNKKMEAEASTLVARIVAQQERLGEKDTQFVARYGAYIGYDAWTRRLRPGKWAELNLERWLPRLRELVRALDGQADGVEICPTLPITAYASVLYQRLQGENSDQRVGWIAGDYGTGKTFAMRALRIQHPDTCYFAEADKGWNNSHGNIVRGLCAAVGILEGNSPREMFSELCKFLNGKRAPTLLIDEAQNAGVALWPCLKTIINKTSARALIGTHPMALRKLMLSTTEAVAEARQILRRSYMPIHLAWDEGVGIADCEVYLRDVFHLENARALADKVAHIVCGDGNLAQLRNAVTNLMADEKEVTPESLQVAARALSAKTLFRSKSTPRGVAA